MSIPRSPVVAPIEYLEDRVPLWQADPAAVGLSTEQAAAAAVLVQAARDAYSAQQAAELAASIALTDRDEAIASMRSFASNLIATIRAFARAENNPGVYATAGLLPPADPTPSPDPVVPTDVTLQLGTQGSIVVRWEGSLALGTYYEVQRTLDNGASWVAVDTVSTRSATRACPPARPRPATACGPSGRPRAWARPAPTPA